MEKKKVQRLIGILVVITMGIVALPMLFSGNSITQDAVASSSESPLAQDNSKGNFNPNDFDLPLNTTNTQGVVLSQNDAAPAVDTSATSTDSSQTTTTTDSTSTTTDVTATQAPIISTESPATDQSANTSTTDQTATPTEATPTLAKDHQTTPRKHKASKRIAKGHWVVQVGSFKNNSHALKLSRQLKAKGFNSFVAKHNGNNRVYIGPARTHSAAKSLADKVINQTNLQAIVTVYKGN